MATVLLVEDTMTEAVIIGGTLRNAGYEIIQAVSSEEAKVKLSQRRPDLIVENLRKMPIQPTFRW
jgi:two-component system, chemotaxis family, response regulator PixH